VRFARNAVALCLSVLLWQPPHAAAGPCPERGLDCFDIRGEAHHLRSSERLETLTFRDERKQLRAATVAELEQIDARLKQRGIGHLLRMEHLEQRGLAIVYLQDPKVRPALRQLIDAAVVLGVEPEGAPAYRLGEVDGILTHRLLDGTARPGNDGSSARTKNGQRLLGGKLFRVLEPQAALPDGAPLVLESIELTPRQILRLVAGSWPGDDGACLQSDWITVEQPASAAGEQRCPPETPAAGPDPWYPHQWHLSAAAGGINAPAAWARAADARPVTVAVLDDGIDVGHPDLGELIAGRWSPWAGSGPIGLTRWDYHGLAAAGLIAAVANNGIGGRGVAPNARVLAVQVMHWDAQGQIRLSQDSEIVRAIDYAAEHASILSASWTLGGRAEDTAACITAAIDRALRRNVALVFAAGNDRVRNTHYPGRLATLMPLIVVGASDRDNEYRIGGADEEGIVWGSAYGRQVTLAAPGVGLVTADPVGVNGKCATGDYARFSGTSAAAPIVAGVAALVQGQRLAQGLDMLAPAALKQRLASSVKPLGPRTRNPDEHGSGRIDACLATGAQECY
jgi:hypothetical protein